MRKKNNQNNSVCAVVLSLWIDGSPDAWDQFHKHVTQVKWCLHRRKNSTCLLPELATAIWKENIFSVEIALLSEIARRTALIQDQRGISCSSHNVHALFRDGLAYFGSVLKKFVKSTVEKRWNAFKNFLMEFEKNVNYVWNIKKPFT